jgi:hypothetical protein
MGEACDVRIVALFQWVAWLSCHLRKVPAWARTDCQKLAPRASSSLPDPMGGWQQSGARATCGYHAMSKNTATDARAAGIRGLIPSRHGRIRDREAVCVKVVAALIT